jgi:HAD superfamily hydrolase (TIGR01509 family)
MTNRGAKDRSEPAGYVPGPSARGFSLVIFDCDGVLIDSEIISARMLIAELAKLGLSIDMDYVTRHFLGRSYPTVIRQVRAEFGIDLPESFEARYRESLLEAFRSGLRIVPHVRAVLERIGVPFCVATSSSPRRADMSLDLVGLRGLVGDRLFTSSQVARGKPEPDLFLHAAAAMGVDPVRTLVIEDSLTGIRAGLAAGMTVWRFVGASHLGPDTPEEPEGARPHRRLVSFENFFQIAPDLKKDERSA